VRQAAPINARALHPRSDRRPYGSSMSSMRAGRPISIAQASFRWNVAAYVTASRGTGRAADLDERLASR